MKKIKILTIVLFSIVLIFPIIMFNWEENVVSPIDNRKLTNNPFGPNYEKGEESDLTKIIENYVQDRIGFRDEMISGYTLLNDKLFHKMVHPIYDYGKDGYVFFKVGNTKKYGEYEKSFADMVKEIQDYCDEREVPFVFVFNPAKITVLEDKLREGIHYNNKWVDEFIEELDEQGVNYVDNRQVLIERTEQGENVFNKKYNAGHWNDLGAFYGVNCILENLKQFYPDIHINEKDEFNIERRLNTSLQVSQFPIYEYEPIFELRNSKIKNVTDQYKDIKLDKNYRTFGYYINEERKAEGAPKALVFQGSYMNGMGYKFLQNSLGEYISVHDYQNVLDFDYYFNIFQPDCVIFETAEYTFSSTYYNYDKMKSFELR